MPKLTDPIVVCSACGEVNDVYESECIGCKMPINPDEAIERATLFGPPPATVVLTKLELPAPHAATTLTLKVTGNGSYVLGRSVDGKPKPDLDLKSWSVAYVSNDPADDAFGMRQRGISSKHALMTINGPVVTIERHPESSLPVFLNSVEVTGAVQLNEGDKVSLGDIFEPGTKLKAPGVIFQVSIQ